MQSWVRLVQTGPDKACRNQEDTRHAVWSQSRDIDDETGLGLVRAGPPDLLWRYLDYLVCQQGSSDPALHTQLALTLADVSLQLQAPPGAPVLPPPLLLVLPELDQPQHFRLWVRVEDSTPSLYRFHISNVILFDCDRLSHTLLLGRPTDVVSPEAPAATSTSGMASHLPVHGAVMSVAL